VSDVLDQQADALIEFCKAQGLKPTPENLKGSMQTIQGMLACLAEKDLPPTAKNLERAYLLVTKTKEEVDESTSRI
jgi:hypothetical protein